MTGWRGEEEEWRRGVGRYVKSANEPRCPPRRSLSWVL